MSTPYETEDEYDRHFRMAPRPRSLLARGSRAVKVDVQESDGSWRSVVKMTRQKFLDKEKGIFLDQYRKWGRMGESAAAAGVTTQTVRKAIQEDPDFAEALLLAEEEYRDKLIGHHQNLVFNGIEKTNYDRNGNVISTQIDYPIRLIELELKKHDSGYREKQEVAVSHSGGVLVAPASLGSVEDWEKKFGEMKDVTPIEGQSESVDD